MTALADDNAIGRQQIREEPVRRGEPVIPAVSQLDMRPIWSARIIRLKPTEQIMFDHRRFIFCGCPAPDATGLFDLGDEAARPDKG